MLLTLTHRRLPDRAVTLLAKLEGGTPQPFWDHFVRLRAEYESRLAA